ncbi:MAG: hypothetical protein ACYDCC_08660 [Actinomycetota bacterium]
MVAITMLLVMLPIASHAGTGCGAGQLVPQLNEFMVNQGLPYDKDGTTFVRGKDALARLFLSMPQCATSTDSIQVTGGTLSVANGTTALGSGALFSPSAPTAILPYYTGTPPTPDNPGDPLFSIPGSILTPCGGAAGCTASSFTATLTATISFTANGAASSITFSRTAPFAQKSNALRLLVIPMGDTSQAFRSQFSTDAETATRQGMSTLARIFPVPNGVGELCPPPSPGSTDPGCDPSQEGGIRYHLDLAAMVNLRSPLLGTGAYIGNPPEFCGNGGNFDGIKRQLAAFLESWNTLHPNNQADDVLGVVDVAITAPVTSCVDGMGAVYDKEAWARAIPDQPGAPSRTGATMSMEIAHTFGVVPCCSRSLTYHSSNTTATDSATGDRAYNVDQRRYIAINHSVMNYSNTTGPWNGDTTFFENPDNSDSLCLLGGPSEGAECTTPMPQFAVGTSQNVNAGPTIVVSGTTDNTMSGTSVSESYVTSNEPLTIDDDASPYRLLETGTAGTLVKGFDVHFVNSAHAAFNESNPSSQSQNGVFEFALADGVSSTNFDLYFCPQSAPSSCLTDPGNTQNGAVHLYGRGFQSVTPAVVSSLALQSGAAVNVTQDSNPNDHSLHPNFSPNGGWVAFNRTFTGNTTYTDANVFVNGFMKTIGTSSGNTLDHCVPPANSTFTPFALTGSANGFLYSEIDMTSFPVGDGKIHRMDGNCRDEGSIPLGAPSDAIPSDVGAIAIDSRDSSIWIATFNETTWNSQTGQFLFHLGANGSFISACNVPSDALPGDGNDTLMFAQLLGLGGSGYFLLTDAGGINTTQNQLYAIDANACTGGGPVLPTATYTSPIGIGATWYDGNGKFWTTDRTSLYSVSIPTGTTGALTVLTTRTIADAPSTGLVMNPFRSELHVAPIGSPTGGGVVSSELPAGYSSFCNNGDLIYVTDTGDIYKTTPDLTTIPPSFSPPSLVFDANETTVTPNIATCLDDGRIVFDTTNNLTGSGQNLYIANSDGTNVQKINLSSNECGMQPYASPLANDNRIVFYSFPCTSTGTFGIRTLNVDTGAESWVLQQTDLSVSISNPTIGSDGRIGFEEGSQIHTVAPDGSDDRLISTFTANSRISTRGSLLSFSDGQDVYISNTTQNASQYDVRGASPDEMRGDLVYRCANGVTEPVTAGVQPMSTTSTDAFFETTFDGSAACGGGGGTLIFYATDGFTRVASTQSQDIPETSTEKAPVAAVTSPPDGQTYSTDGVIPLSGGGADAQDGEAPTLSWTLDGVTIGSGSQVDAAHPSGGWSPGTHTISLTATNSGGVSSTTSRSITIVDDVAPLVTVSHTPDGSNGYNLTSPVDVGVVASDDGSGLASLACTLDGSPIDPNPLLTPGDHSYSGTISVSGDGVHSVSCTPTDKAGNVGSASSDTVNIDTTVPTVSITSPDPSYTYQLNEAANASYSCSDDNLVSCSGPVANGAAIDTSKTGTFSFAVTGTDFAGNSNTTSVSYTVIDETTPPSLMVTHTADGANGWNRSTPTNVGVMATDSGLGVLSIACTVDGKTMNPAPALTPNAASYSGIIAVSGEGTHAIACSASNRAGYTANASDTVNIDTIPPAVSVTNPVVNATYYSGQAVPASYSCSDSGSGIASCIGDVSNGANIDTSTPGAKAFTVWATDVAGNIRNIAVPYTVNPSCSSLTGLDADYSTHPLFTFGGVKLTLNAPKAEATLHLRAPSCSSVSYTLHVMNSAGTSELHSQSVSPSTPSSTVSFSVDMGNGVLGQFLDPSSVCVWAESQAPSNAQYYRIPLSGCVSLTEDGPSQHA